MGPPQNQEKLVARETRQTGPAPRPLRSSCRQKPRVVPFPGTHTRTRRAHVLQCCQDLAIQVTGAL